MRHRWNAWIALAAFLAFGGVPLALAGEPPKQAPGEQKAITRPAPPPEWEVGVVTSGGFAGNGKGTISLRSDGAFTPRFPCKLDPERLADVARAVAAARPEKWQAPAPTRSLIKDQFSYSLFLRVKYADDRQQSFRIGWREQNYFDLPADLRNLNEAVWAARHQLSTGCE